MAKSFLKNALSKNSKKNLDVLKIPSPSLFERAIPYRYAVCFYANLLTIGNTVFSHFLTYAITNPFFC